MKVEIEKTNGQERENWNFWFDEKNCQLVFDSYYHYYKKTNRSSFKPIRIYSRLFKQNNTLTLSQVPDLEEVKQLALQKFIGMIKVVDSL